MNFCTLFDSNYLSRGLCMYESLIRVCPDFHLFVFAFDDEVYSLLSKLKLPKTSIISLHEFEDDELLSVKPIRSRGEYCWTATSSTILYCLKNFNLDHCIYVDADIYFYTNPSILIEEVGEYDVMITEHRYTSEYDISHLYGKYCVQFILFKNTNNGINILNWWRTACLNWCYAKIEDGKFGDQKYLDNWTEIFERVHVIENLGGGIGPWNVQQYDIIQENSRFLGSIIKSKISFEVVFYHFHHLNYKKINFINEFNLGPYKLQKEVVDLIYKPYINELILKEKFLRSIGFQFGYIKAHGISLSWLRLLYYITINTLKRDKILIFNQQ